jgi:PRTRC genetic system protein E
MKFFEAVCDYLAKNKGKLRLVVARGDDGCLSVLAQLTPEEGAELMLPFAMTGLAQELDDALPAELAAHGVRHASIAQQKEAAEAAETETRRIEEEKRKMEAEKKGKITGARGAQAKSGAARGAVPPVSDSEAAGIDKTGQLQLGESVPMRGGDFEQTAPVRPQEPAAPEETSPPTALLKPGPDELRLF